MNWNKGSTNKDYMTLVDPRSWVDKRNVNIAGGTIRREVSNLMESADVNCNEKIFEQEKWTRIWRIAHQDDTSERQPLFTGLSISPQDSYNGRLINNTVQCYSVLKPAEDIYLPRGWYAPQGFSGSALVKQLLDCTPAPKIESEFSPSLNNSIIAEENETRLSMAHKILQAINWRLRIDGYGRIYICPKDTEPRIIINTQNMDIVEQDVNVKRDLFNCPNVFRAIAEDLVGIARDDSENSMLSTVNRGREVWAVESNCDLNDEETVSEYALRRLKELQATNQIVNYSRRFVPDILPNDMVRLQLPEQNLDDNYIVKSQTLTLGKSKVDEEVWHE